MDLIKNGRESELQMEEKERFKFVSKIFDLNHWNKRGAIIKMRNSRKILDINRV